jgi:hypothetical protein
VRTTLPTLAACSTNSRGDCAATLPGRIMKFTPNGRLVSSRVRSSKAASVDRLSPPARGAQHTEPARFRNPGREFRRRGSSHAHLLDRHRTSHQFREPCGQHRNSGPAGPSSSPASSLWLMGSAMGQKRRFAWTPITSALPQRADIFSLGLPHPDPHCRSGL